ncbi:hypothetical protein LTR12_017018 [Friedmanniomyces endolithicus]|uniref:Brl1/Brr6 domain-containing protein n=1 Tax=Friedmanniomyces endolithicus TaxID=329885 RepID=A0A4U0V572_9PEZI|nr:hypothetical protein LTS09_003088 [Friedmanniomyces endolithicus]KAK1808627.1 hypothetical protein LTR12_017018 [Friedmanniomyces endolithicus]TKA43871.1 hypothetical protein B0A54_05631 [Friedmanniomyces endolithicus]
MSRSMKETPMDFEYQNRTGPMDSRSGFARVGQTPHLFSQTAKKRDYDAYDSPPKFSTNHLPSPSKPLPPRPVFNSLFSTPRRTNNDIDDSSAGETPRSPEQNNDSDAAPDTTNVRNALISSHEAASMPTQPGAAAPERPSPQKSNSWITTQLTKAKHKFASPGRGEIARSDHTSGTEHRVEKRRKRDTTRKASRKRRHSMSDSNDSDDDSRSSHHAHLSSPRKPSTHSHQTLPEPPERKQHWLTTLWTFIETHPTVPHILSWYAQLAFNIFLLSCFAYAISSAWRAFTTDINHAAHSVTLEIMAEMAACAREYTANRCAEGRVPAMETVCENWRGCMERDPLKVGRAKVSARTFAEVFNSFMEPISYKAMGFTFLMVFGCFGISNLALYVLPHPRGTLPLSDAGLLLMGGNSGLFRKTESVGAYPPQAYYPPPPPTPQRAFSGQGQALGQDGGFYGGGGGTPWQQGMGLEPLPSGVYGQIEGRGSPVRRLQY